MARFLPCFSLILVFPFLMSGYRVYADPPGMLTHQGRIMEGAVNYHGTGFFKFALVGTTDPPAVYWSNDGSLDGQTTNNAPAAAVQRTVSRGLYAVILGETAVANMTTIPASVFADNCDVRLRVWFGKTAMGAFERLDPDQRLAAAAYAMTAASVVSDGVRIVDGNVKLGGGSGTPQEGAIRWTGVDFEAYDGARWISLTSGQEQPTPIEMEFVTVGDPGNGSDPGNTVDPNTYGAVADEFKIGKFEVTNAQYTAFLNAVAASDPNALYSTSMGTDPRGGITRLGASGSFTYTERANMAEKPVNYVSFWDACRFCNWLHNGQPVGAQTQFTTEDGAYDLTDPIAISNNTVPRKSGAKYFIPTENEWYKAAYFQPSAQGGDSDSYWLYPTGNNVVPTIATADAIGNIDNDTGNIANYDEGADWNGKDGNVTTVGSGGPGSASHYGAFDMCGNVYEWNESLAFLRGGSYADISLVLQSSFRIATAPTFEFVRNGFRVASP